MSREFTIQSEVVSSIKPPEILVRLGFLPDAPIPAADYPRVMYGMRIEIEKIIALLYRYDPSVFAENIETLVALIHKTTRGTYKQDELEGALTTVLSVRDDTTVPIPKTAAEAPLLPPSPQSKSLGIKKKLNSAIQVRSLSARILEAVITLISAFPQESISKLHQDTFEFQETLRALSSLLAFIRAGLTLIAATKHAGGYHISEEEKNLTALTRFMDQMKRNAPQLSRDIIWGIVRFIGWKDDNLQKNLMEMTLGLFGFVLLQSMAVQYHERQFYNHCILYCEKDIQFRANAIELNSAITTAKNETMHQHNIQMMIWLLYVIGALICVIGKECSKTSETIELALGSILIVLTCIGQILWDRSKLNLMALINTASELTTRDLPCLSIDTVLAVSVQASSDDDAETSDRGSVFSNNSPRLFQELARSDSINDTEQPASPHLNLTTA